MPNNSLSSRFRAHWPIFGLVFYVLVFYIYSLCPDVYLIDSGELAAVSYTLGIAHPTGYPLYTIISYFFAHLPGEPIRNLNLLSALFSVAATAVVVIMVHKITRHWYVSLVAASLFAFSPTIWRTSVTNEVYPLTGLFAVSLLCLVYYLHDDRVYYIMAYLAGLSMTNHITIFSLILPLLFYIIIVYRPGLRRALFGALLFAAGISIYSYILTRTLGGAKLAWGNVTDMQRLFWHVTGKQYQVWMFTLSSSDVLKNLLGGLHVLARDFLYVLIVPSLLGFVVLFRKDKRKFWLLLATLLLNLLYAINYSIPDIEPYYIPSVAVLTVTFAYGTDIVRKYLKPVILMPIALAIPFLNYRSCTLRDNTFGTDFGMAHIEQLPHSALLLTTYWDTYAPIMYLRHVKQIRTDLVVIDKELLRRTWYIKYLAREYPLFFGQVQAPLDAYLEQLYKFEYARPYSPSVIQSKFINMLECFVDARIDDGSFLATPWIDPDLSRVRPAYSRIPFGMTLRLTRDATFLPYDFSRLRIRKPAVINDPRLAYNLEIVQRMLRSNISYLEQTNHPARALEARRVLELY